MKQILVLLLIVSALFIYGCSYNDVVDANVIDNIEVESDSQQEITEDEAFNDIDADLIDESDEVEIGSMI